MKELKIPRPHRVRRMLREQQVCGESEIPIGMVLVYSAYVGEIEPLLAYQTRLPISEVKEICKVLRRNGVFGKHIDHYKDYMARDGGISLCLDISCGLGWLQRSKRNGEAAYKMTAKGKDYVRNNLLNGAKK